MADRSRRRFLHTTALLGGGGLAALVGHAQDQPTPSTSQDLITPEAQNAIDRGLTFLASTQAADGTFSDSRPTSGNVAITSLAGLALLAGGHHPGRGRYGPTVTKAAQYVSSRGNGAPVGYLSSGDAQFSHDGMYQHGFGALFLSEVYGTLPNLALQRQVRDKLEKAVELTVKAQNNEGGWRYSTEPRQADVSVTVAQLMALRAARNAGMAIDKSKVDKAVEYIKGCQQSDGGFCYIKGQPAGSAFARSAAAVVGLFCAGVYEGKEIDRGLRYLTQFRPGREFAARDFRQEHYFYGQYYAALAMWTAGGNYWSAWFPAIRDELVARATAPPNRLWADYHGTAYATSMACIILQLPNNYLPIMQK